MRTFSSTRFKHIVLPEKLIDHSLRRFEVRDNIMAHGALAMYADEIACHYVSLCRSISPLPLRPFPSRCIRLCLQCVPGEVLGNKDTESVRSSDTGANLSTRHVSTLLGIGCTDISSESYFSDSQRRIDVTCLKYSPRR